MTSVSFFELVLALTAGAVGLSLLAGRVGLPPAAPLVVGGMILALVPQVPALTLDPDLILVLFLPPLLMSSAHNTAWRDFQEQLRPILLLSVGAVLFTSAAVAVVAHAMIPRLPWSACFALGAIVSPPDAVAAKAVLQRLRLPRRLLTILEGESLVNDASGLVVYRFAVAAALTGTFSAAHAGSSFVYVVVVGIAFGMLCGFCGVELIRRLHDTQSVIALTFIFAWFSYIVAERIGASGVLATVACGAVASSKMHAVIGANERVQAGAVWSFVIFVLESFVFVLIGLALRGVLERRGGDAMLEGGVLPLTLGVIAVVVVARFVWVYATVVVQKWLLRQSRMPPAPVLVIVGWAGMRGVVTLAAALALPLSFPGRDAILVASFGVILFTVLVQGTTLGPLIARLGIQNLTAGPSAKLLSMIGARVAINGAAVAMLEAMVDEGSGELLHPQLTEDYRRRLRGSEKLQNENADRSVVQQHFATALLALGSARSELLRLHRTRRIHDHVLNRLQDELDFEELRLRQISGQLAG